MIRYNSFLHGYHKLMLLANRDLFFIPYKYRHLGLALILIILSGCVQLEPRYQWQSFDQPLSTVERSLVLVVLNNEKVRKKVEADWVLALRKQGVDAGPGYGLISPLKALNGEELIAKLNQHELDAVLVVSIALDESIARYEVSNVSTKLSDYVDQQLLLDADLFLQQRDAVGIQVSAFTLVDEGLRWRSTYVVPVVSGGVDWGSVIHASIANMQEQGLRLTLQEQQPDKEEVEPE